MSQREWRRRSVLLATMGAWAAPCASVAAEEPLRGARRVTLALAARQSLYQLPLTLADQLGFFRQAGLNVEWQVHDSGAKALASAVQGNADVVACAFDHVFGLQHKGQNYQAFVQMGRTPQVTLGVSSRLDMHSMSALRGARVGVSSLECSTYWMACHWLMQNGLMPQEVVFVEVGSSGAALEAMRTGGIDALCNPDPTMHWLEHKNDIRVLGEARSLVSTRKLLGGLVPGACLMARGEFLQKQADVAQALSDAVVRALKWLQTAGVTDMLKTVPAHHWMGDRAVYLGAFDKLRESYALDGLMAPDAVKTAWLAHKRLPLPSGRSVLNLERTYTNAFAAKSPSRIAV